MKTPKAVNKKFILGMGMGWILSLFSLTGVWAQLSSPTADQVDTLSYPAGNPDRDPLFVFYQTDQVHKAGSLTATYPGPGNYNFEWSRYNPAGGFDPVFSSDPATTSSSVSDLDNGGYRVRIWDGTGTDTSMLAWVMLDKFRNYVAQTDDGLLPSYLYTCDFVALAGFVFPDTLVYYDPVSLDTLVRPLGFRFKWTSDNDELDIPYDTVVLRPNTTYKPPYEDTEYYLTATDDFGMVDVDTVFYESIQTRADFILEYRDKVLSTKDSTVWDADLDGNWSDDRGSLDARLTARFTNESRNGATFEWVFLDTLGGIKQSETTYDLETTTEYTYETADKYYYPYLVSTSEAGCIDTVVAEGGIHVVPSQLVIPNVFSPNGDGTNDRWIFKHQSLKTCRVSIVDRSGKVVYKREIDDIYSWDGWDGNMHNGMRKAPEGQYYFVVEATGYDGKEFADPTITEQWKLNRGNKNTGSSPGSTPPGGTDPVATSQTLYTGWLYIYRH